MKKNLNKKGKALSLPLPSMIILAAILLGCLFAQLIMNHDPSWMDLAHPDNPPGSTFYFGTDSLGRDLFSMIWYGGRSSLLIGFLATLISTVVAVLYGTLSGIAKPFVDDCMMRFTEILLSIPSILLIIFVQAMIGKQNVLAISFIIGITGWMSVAKMVRSEVRLIRSQEYVLIAKHMGGGFFHLLRRHYAPNFISAILFMVVMNIRSAIIAESTLSFLGLGLPLDVITWGSMLSLSEKALTSSAWWVILIPGLFLIVTLMCITNIGNYLRERMV